MKNQAWIDYAIKKMSLEKIIEQYINDICDITVCYGYDEEKKLKSLLKEFTEIIKIKL